MAPKSFKQMRLSGELIRADAEKMDYFKLHIEPGFNPEGRNEEDDESDDELYAYIVKHGPMALPQMEVRPREEGGAWIVDGHRRHKQIGRAIQAGAIAPDKKTGLHLIPVRQFGGNDLQRLYRIKTSNKNKPLAPLQFAELCRRARDGFNQSVKDIADGMQCSISAVEQALILASANHDVHQLVKAGEVSKTTAVKIVRSKGESAGAVLKEAQQAARMQGKKKITAKQIEGNTPADLVRAIHQEMESGGSFRAEELAPKFAPLISYLRGTKKTTKGETHESK